ncbi:DUF5988 family protein [Spirillospora sp. NPDC048911]|uniref:DUF5988 family protein n=1 Tax=Spirillospora sp. NPDC048911 TaxID=3364527 RepID=UPI0037182C43
MKTHFENGEIEIHLEGGPPDLPRRQRVSPDAIAGGKIKLQRLGGWEHFECEAIQPSAILSRIVFRWTQRTRIAE